MPGATNENGDIEQRHYRFKQAVAQALMMLGSREFASVADSEEFSRKLFARLNAGRRLDKAISLVATVCAGS
jgi:hypothetical protein